MTETIKAMANNIILAIKENYNVEVTYEEVEHFGNLTIYKIVPKGTGYFGTN